MIVNQGPNSCVLTAELSRAKYLLSEAGTSTLGIMLILFGSYVSCLELRCAALGCVLRSCAFVVQ